MPGVPVKVIREAEKSEHFPDVILLMALIYDINELNEETTRVNI